MTITSIVIVCYLLTGLAIAGGSNVLFIKSGFKKFCFSTKETTRLAIGWPYYMLGALVDWD